MGRSIAGMRASRENEAERKAALRAQGKNPNKLLAAAAIAAGNPLASPQRMGIKTEASEPSNGGVKEKIEEKESGHSNVHVAAGKRKAGDDKKVTTQAQIRKRRSRRFKTVAEDEEDVGDNGDANQVKKRKREGGGPEVVTEESQEDEGTLVNEGK